jgi:hypothetical protein
MLRPILVALLFTFSLPAQQEEDVDIAFARSSPTWTVVEKSGGSRWDATWTLRPDGKSFDAHWKQTPGGAQGDLRNFARIISMAGARIVIERPGLGRYTGKFSADRQRITGTMSWAPGSWTVSLSAPAGPTSVATQTPAPGGNTWRVVETVGSSVWTATWTLRKDGTSFDATWTHTPGNDSGKLTNFAHIRSRTARDIIIERPGLGQYTGTFSANGKRITGKMSWANGTWTVTLP